ncbi:MAG: hypothetical protein Q9159_005072 [Coniocarpon cinnabarinum]
MAPEDSSQEKHTSPQLDVEKLHSLPSEQQDLYLLTFTSELARHVSALDAEAATALQLPVKQEVLKIIELPSPIPTRVIRNNLGQCLAGVLNKGDRKILFETVNQLVELINASKGPKDSANKHAAVHCLGIAFETAGDSAISTAPLAGTVLLRTLKAASNHAGLRASVIKALGRVVRGVNKSMDDQISRDILKQARQLAANDKALLVQSHACWCLEQLSLHTPYFDNHSDFDKLQQVLWKALDASSSTVRRAASSCLSAVYVKHYSKSGGELAAKPKKLKKTKTAPQEDGEEGMQERAASPGPQTPVMSFTVTGILRQLVSQYCKPTTSNRSRAGIISTLSKTLRKLGEVTVEEEYGTIASQLFNDLLNSNALIHNRYRLLVSRKFVRIVLSEVVGKKILGESAQINAVRFLVNGILKDYPQSEIRERPEPSKQVLIGALDALTVLIECLQSASNTVADQCKEALLQVLEHPSYTVQVHASRCLKTFVLACPSQLLPCVTICMNSVKREIGQLSNSRKSPRRCLGFALGLAAAVSTAAQQPLYGSIEAYARILTQATSILKSSSGADIRISSIQIQVAWIMIGGLMSLGPNFVKIHLSQLLLLWRNALPKPLADENIGKRTLMELTFLAHVKECALSSISAFLAYNKRLVTVDVAKRIALMLTNTTEFLNSLPVRKTSEEPERRLNFSLQLQDFDLMIRRRVFECSSQILEINVSEAHHEILQSSILSAATSCFTEPDNMVSTSLSSSIASSTGSADAIWDVGDNSGFGITSLVRGLDDPVHAQGFDLGGQSGSPTLNLEEHIDQLIRTPVCDAPEHDALRLYVDRAFDMTPPPTGTGAIDAAIRVFALSVPLQSARVQSGTVEQILSQMSHNFGQQSTAKEIALFVNVSCALIETLFMSDKGPAGMNAVKSIDVEKAYQELFHKFLMQPDLAARRLAAQGLSRLCKCCGSDFTKKEINWLTDEIINNRDPHVRSGCAMALGCISSVLGGMAAGLHLKNMLGILTSLASDQYPAVHFWALDALSKIADATGLAFLAFVPSTLGLLAQLYVAESHGEECASFGSSNMEVDIPSLTAIARGIDSMVNVLGPDLQDNSKTRNMILTLTYQFQTESSSLVAAQSLKCLENLSMYAPGHISFAPYVRQLQSKLTSNDPEVLQAALTGLYNAMKRGAEELVATAETPIEEQVWLVLHEAYGQGIAKDLIHDWVHQSGISHIHLWVHRIQGILTKVKAQKIGPLSGQSAKAEIEPDLQDEEAAGFAAAAVQTAKDDPDKAPEAGQELLRWQVRNTAMEALNDILSGVAKDVDADDDSTNIEVLQPRVADMIKIAFSASTAGVVEIRIQGIQILGSMLKIFGRVPDPDFPEATLLEQYQAQISSALTPAFAADSSPTLAAEAIGVCASFISTGIVTSVDRMGRILKLLVSALDDFSKEAESLSIGDLKGLSSNAQVMVRLATFSAWAELQIASHDQTYLADILRPHLAKLAPLWLSSLRDYAKLKFEPDITGAASTGALGTGLDVIYSSLNRATLLNFYHASWLSMVDAIASLIDENSELVFDALDEKTTTEKTNGLSHTQSHDINYRDEPVAFFFVLFGISFEALSTKQNDSSAVTAKRNLDILRALKKIANPAVAGMAIYQDAIFSEMMDTLARMALTEGVEIQTVIVGVARDLCINHPSARRETAEEEESHLSDDIDQLFELTRITVLILSRYIPNLSEMPTPSRSTFPSETITLMMLALTALVDSASVFPSVIRSDLHACILHIFSSVLTTPSCQESLVPNALPIFRRFILSLSRNAPSPETTSQLRTMLRGVTSIIKNAQKREMDAAVAAEKNSLLAGTILLTSAGKVLPANDDLVANFLYELLGCLDSAMTTKVAAGLSRSLLLLPTTAAQSGRSAHSTEAKIASTLLPRLVSFLVAPSEIEGTEEARGTVAGALISFVLSLPHPSAKNAAAGIVIPAVMQRARQEGEKTWPDTSGRLLELARREPALFKSVVAGMDVQQKSFVEEVLRRGGGVGINASAASHGRETAKEESAPTIALKMDF